MRSANPHSTLGLVSGFPKATAHPHLSNRFCDKNEAKRKASEGRNFPRQESIMLCGVCITGKRHLGILRFSQWICFHQKIMLTTPVQWLLLLLMSPIPCESPPLPISDGLLALRDRWQDASSRIASQWENPNDVLTILLIIGGDIVQKALAQLSGGYFVPVAFSFGWVSYSISALLGAYSDGALMPSTTFPSTLINAHSGYARPNHSWILNRILRGVESSLEPLDVALCVSVYRCKPYDRQIPYDWPWRSGMITMGLQLVVSGIPFVVDGDWSILSVTGTGTLLALIGGSLPQWRNEKWGNRYDDKGYTFCLTRGNGFQHVVVIQNEPRRCLHLESLALPRRTGCSRGCKTMVAILAMLWILFLVNVCGLRKNTWYLLGVGFMGMAQNIFVAAIPRQPCTMGLRLEFVERIVGEKVMTVLKNTEVRFPSVGASLVQIFFPGKLRDGEQEFWKERAELARKPVRTETANDEQSTGVSLSPTSSAQTPKAVPTPQIMNPISSACAWIYTPIIRKRRCSV